MPETANSEEREISSSLVSCYVIMGKVALSAGKNLREVAKQQQKVVKTKELKENECMNDADKDALF